MNVQYSYVARFEDEHSLNTTKNMYWNNYHNTEAYFPDYQISRRIFGYPNIKCIGIVCFLIERCVKYHFSMTTHYYVNIQKTF